MLTEGCAGFSGDDLVQLRSDLEEAEIFCIDNVSEYLFAQTDQEIWDVKEHFPCLAPPFSFFWMEYCRPTKINSCEHGVRSSEALPHRVGFIFEATAAGDLNKNLSGSRELVEKQLSAQIEQINRLSTIERKNEIDALAAEGADIGNPHEPMLKRLSSESSLLVGAIQSYLGLKSILDASPERLKRTLTDSVIAKGARWIVNCTPFMQAQRNSLIFGPLGKQTLIIGDAGNVIEEISMLNGNFVTPAQWNTQGEGFSTLWFPALLAISFCNCRNVKVAREEPPSRRFKKALEERGHQRLIYKTLEISPIKEVLERAGAQHNNGLARALHICRGHFAYYEEKGLFGKYKGRFWIPQHVKGSIKTGAVVKDYKVTT